MERIREKTCFMCGNQMKLSITSKTLRFQGKEIEIKGISAYLCPHCGEIVYTSQEVKMIENIINALSKIEVPKIDVLNLEETAQYLRVSNQTVYNMIRDGRIKAYKVGREWRFLMADIVAYMNASSNEDFVSMAAKGGQISSHDAVIIQAALAEEDD